MSSKSIKSIDLLVSGAFRLLKAFFFVLPRRACLALGRGAGSLLYRIDRRHRELVLSNLAAALGDETRPADRERIAREAFRVFGQVTADIVKWTRLGHRRRLRLISLEGGEHLHRALEEGRGVLLFSAHFGNWEVGSLAASRLGRLNVVARPLDSPGLERQLVRFRETLGASVISKFQAARPILQALRRNEIVAILIDQNVLRSQAVFVDFFGRAAATTPALASFHCRTLSPILPIFCYPTPARTYVVRIGPPVETELSGDTALDVLKITARCTKMVESEIRRNPSLWFWFHNRWKTRPPDAPRKEDVGHEQDA